MTETKGEYKTIEDGAIVWSKDYGRGVVLESYDGEVFVRFDEKRYEANFHIKLVHVSHITTTPPLPEGYTLASEPPSNDRDIMLLLDDGAEKRGYGYWSASINKNVWVIYTDWGVTFAGDKVTNVIGWRELK